MPGWRESIWGWWWWWWWVLPRQRRQKNAWWLRVGEPQEEGYDVDSRSFPLNNLPKVINPVGLDDLSEGCWCWLPLALGSLHQRGICTDTNQNFAQHETERLSISPVLQKQRVKRMVWKTAGKTASNRKQMIAAGCVNSMRKLDQGPQFTSGVSLRTDN